MNAEDYSKRGGKCFIEKDFDGAIADYTEAIKLEPGNPFNYSERGHAHIQKKELDLAIADFNKAIQLEPNKFGDFYAYRGGAYVLKGNKNLAISDFEMAVKIDPQNKDYREALGELKGGKTQSTSKQVSYSNFLDDLTDWDPTYDPRGQLKRRGIGFLIVLVIGLITGVIGLGWLSGGITGGMTGAIFGAIYGFGIVNLLAFIINELKNIRNDFVGLREYFDDISALIKRFLFVLIIKTIYRLFKVLLYTLYLSPFIGIYQGIRLLIERGKLKRSSSDSSSYSSSGSGAVNELFEFINNGPVTIGNGGYIYTEDGSRIGSITGLNVHACGQGIGEIKGNEIYDFSGNLICHIENGRLVK